MTVKTTGAEYKRFYADESIWLKGMFHEDEIITVDGKENDQYDLVVENMADAAVVNLAEGFVTDDDGSDFGSMESFFKKWRKSQSTVSFIVECHKDKERHVRECIKQAGGKALK